MLRGLRGSRGFGCGLWIPRTHSPCVEQRGPRFLSSRRTAGPSHSLPTTSSDESRLPEEAYKYWRVLLTGVVARGITTELSFLLPRRVVRCTAFQPEVVNHRLPPVLTRPGKSAIKLRTSFRTDDTS